jgi:hypothetical protein
MNNNQRIAIAFSLVIIGLMLFYVMVQWGNGYLGLPHSTLLYSSGYYDTSGTPIGLYIRYGIPGILLGIATPLGLWMVALYVALGWKKEVA